MIKHTRFLTALAVAALLSFAVAACGSDDSSGSGSSSKSSDSGGDLKGSIAIDGSSTVGPFTEAAAELFNEDNPDVKVTVGKSGTGGGFEKFCAGETDISDASRPIKPDEEVPVCKKNSVTYGEVQVANDGIAVVDQPRARSRLPHDRPAQEALEQGLEGRRSCQGDRSRAPGHEAVACTGPAPTPARSTSSPTRSTARRASSRKDYEPSEDDNQLVTGVSGDKGGLGYFGFSYYERNQDKLNLVVGRRRQRLRRPSTETIQDGSYKPLSRPLFMYPSDEGAAAPGGQGVHGVHRGQLRRRSPSRRRSCR